MITPRGKDKSASLTEVRTVLSRAETALENLLEDSYMPNKFPYKEYDSENKCWILANEPYGDQYKPDPDVAEMWEAMNQVVELLDRWRRIKGNKK